MLLVAFLAPLTGIIVAKSISSRLKDGARSGYMMIIAFVLLMAYTICGMLSAIELDSFKLVVYWCS